MVVFHFLHCVELVFLFASFLGFVGVVVVGVVLVVVGGGVGCGAEMAEETMTEAASTIASYFNNVNVVKNDGL